MNNHPRYKNENGVDIQLTPEEETARNAEEATWEEERPAREMDKLRLERNNKLTECDWTHYTDSPLGDEAKASWASYRQELRDLPETVADPTEPTWPEAPE